MSEPLWVIWLVTAWRAFWAWRYYGRRWPSLSNAIFVAGVVTRTCQSIRAERAGHDA